MQRLEITERKKKKKSLKANNEAVEIQGTELDQATELTIIKSTFFLRMFWFIASDKKAASVYQVCTLFRGAFVAVFLFPNPPQRKHHYAAQHPQRKRSVTYIEERVSGLSVP